MKIHYRKGSENARADAMSRRQDYMKGNKPQEFQLLNWNADGTLKINKIAATSLVDLDTLPDKIRKSLLTDRLAKGVREAPEENEVFQDVEGLL